MRFKVSDPNLSQTLYRELENTNFQKYFRLGGSYGVLNADGDFILSEFSTVHGLLGLFSGDKKAIDGLRSLLPNGVVFEIFKGGRRAQIIDSILGRQEELSGVLEIIRDACTESQSLHMKDFMRLASADTAQKRGKILREIGCSSCDAAGSPVDPIGRMKEMLLLSQKTSVTTASQKGAKEEMNLLLTNAIEAFELISKVDLDSILLNALP